MRDQWYDLQCEASGGEPDFVCWSMAQELVDPTYTEKDRSALCTSKAKGV